MNGRSFTVQLDPSTLSSPNCTLCVRCGHSMFSSDTFFHEALVATSPSSYERFTRQSVFLFFHDGAVDEDRKGGEGRDEKGRGRGDRGGGGGVGLGKGRGVKSAE